jgi:hypothetical protein
MSIMSSKAIGAPLKGPQAPESCLHIAGSVPAARGPLGMASARHSTSLLGPVGHPAYGPQQLSADLNRFTLPWWEKGQPSTWELASLEYASLPVRRSEPFSIQSARALSHRIWPGRPVGQFVVS